MKSKNTLNIAFDQIADALAAIRNGECVVVVDDESRENEGDLICAAQFATPQQINFMATEARGLICLAMDGEKLDQLDLPLMVDRNTDSNQTAFTISIDAGPEYGVSTGISAEDRARTIQVALNPKAKPSHLRRPGHVFPLRANKGGVLKRAGHTEAAVDLSLLSGLSAAGVICEIQNADGSMARLPELRNYAKTWGLKIISIADLIKFRLENERFVYRKASTRLPSIFGKFEAIGYVNELDGTEHVALVKGKIGKLKEPVLVRMHSECLTGDAFGSLRCDCRPQLEAALSKISEEGEGIVVYLRQEGRGIGLINKLRAYSLQDGGLDTVEANEKLGFPADLRNYGVGAQILTDLGIHRLRLLTNNPRKIAGLGGYGIKVESREPLVISPGDHNAEYLAIKQKKLGHLIGDQYKNEEGKYYVVFWDGASSAQMLSIFRIQAEQKATENNLELLPENSSRLLALLERPQFVWRIKKEIKIDKIISILETMVNWEGTTKIGLFVSSSKEQAIHPSQDLETDYLDINLLSSNITDQIKKNHNKKLPYLLIWK
ncbi:MULTISPECIES: bifunctional 3,4-dihydroxy-2-butanone-4-phosphate synthase/GTP cyclohydrolase II [unclassified Prochlorococcus]|uniref:bifunctional 3,4-dihydroxy-2-butanone-4-phosphate synthase/GTP cyclohydrolase II n=1 Tax=unclassified Prochlorococcus TaxID=2627481 RepID=UPI0005338190|nr:MULTISPECIES: bifunctional 3,4-dihydroxy-2-butanone-4-phosphate synthase/GTP cyclohydrolase II [unclassified Prochlorococcus]KGG15266.1 3,4-dihydroxy-2-butanone 4-phosphate synthase [Prochlorococcus sp. MIT 0602]KGG17543.1 3,4-dihydroxy-2-butanone 4-phosphate synthase [Prochlorococcus sp. MIT 0603]